MTNQELIENLSNAYADRIECPYYAKAHHAANMELALSIHEDTTSEEITERYYLLCDSWK